MRVRETDVSHIRKYIVPKITPKRTHQHACFVPRSGARKTSSRSRCPDVVIEASIQPGDPRHVLA